MSERGEMKIAEGLSHRRTKGPGDDPLLPEDIVKKMELQAVRLREPCEGYPAGTEGVIIAAFPDGAIVEVDPADDDPHGLAMLTTRWGQLVLGSEAKRLLRERDCGD